MSKISDKFERVITVLGIITAIISLIFMLWFVLEFKEMLNDYRCNHLPINEFFQDKNCEKYWKYRE